MQTQQNVESNVKHGDFRSDARGNAKLMINFVLPYSRKKFGERDEYGFVQVLSKIL